MGCASRKELAKLLVQCFLVGEELLLLSGVGCVFVRVSERCRFVPEVNLGIVALERVLPRLREE